MRKGMAQSCAALAGPVFGYFRGVVFVEEENVDDDEGGAYGDGGVGDVEGRPVVTAEPDFEEVGDRAVDDAIGNVPGSATEQHARSKNRLRKSAARKREGTGNHGLRCGRISGFAKSDESSRNKKRAKGRNQTSGESCDFAGPQGERAMAPLLLDGFGISPPPPTAA